MSDAPKITAAELPEELSAVDQLLHRGEANPRTRSGIMGVELLDATPDWDRFRTRFENASRKVLRLRQKVVMPTLPTAAPRWVIDPDFNLDFHVRRVRVPAPGTLREVMDLAEVALQSPMDISRPLWTATLVEGLADGRAATMLHLSHAVTDGVGAIEMFANIYDVERDPPPVEVAPLPIPEDLSPNDLMREGFNRLPRSIAGGVRGAIGGTASALVKAVRDPISSVGGVINYARSSARVMGPVADPSPLLRRRSLSSRTEAIDIKFSDLHKASKAAGGSINDAYLAGLCGALRLYHEANGIPITMLPMAVPVNLRSDDDPAGGNRFAGVNLAAPVGVVDPTKRVQKVRTQMMRKREERAIDMVGAMAPLISLLPDPILESVAGSVVSSDVQASNVPIYPGDTFIAGAKILRHYGIGPLPGVAMMVVLVSRAGYCTITTRYDRAAIADEALWARCLQAGFDEVLALGGDGRSTPASFTPRSRRLAHLGQWECRAMNSQNGQTTRRGDNVILRLPGSVAEIDASPPGPKVGAFFDLDGTLVAGFTGVVMTQDRLRRGQMGVGEFIGMVQAGLNHQLGRSEFEDLIGKGARMLHGSSLSDLDELGERLFVQSIQKRIYPEMRQLVRAHMARGHTVVLSSSALTVQVEPVAKFLGIKNILSNKFETDDDGLITGEVLRPIIWGPGKARAVQAFSAKNDIDLTKSYFYADGDEDVALMYLVGNPRPTNPAGKLEAVAAKRGWPILKFTSRSGSSPVAQLRTAAGIASLLPAAAGALGLGLLTRNRRTGVNFFTSTWTRLLMASIGIDLNVNGEENLTAKRPAVFLFNHRNQVDPFIAGRLISDNFTSVGKKELEKDPLMGTVGRVLDAAFIDRDDPKAAVEGLHKIEELARKGISVLIAPEGTRLDTTEVGEFKKGPFRIAMAAGVPLVPIVIRNAEVIAERNSSTFNPGSVDVAVFPPISVDDWTGENLNDRIAEVRQLYLDTLKDWPQGALPSAPLYERDAKPAKKAPAKKAGAKKAPAKKAGAKVNSVKKGRP